jgi:hypothetical protein
MAPDLQGMITVARIRNRKGPAKLMPKSNKSWWEKTFNYYQVLPANPGDLETFEAYICPYRDNETNTKFLGMNGCTFGVGIPNANGGVLVGHVNAANQALDTGKRGTSVWRPSRRLSDRVSRQGLGNMIDPSVYRAGDKGGPESDHNRRPKRRRLELLVSASAPRCGRQRTAYDDVSDTLASSMLVSNHVAVTVTTPAAECALPSHRDVST